MNKMTKLISNLSKKSSHLRIIGLILILLSFITFLVFTIHQGKKIEQQEIAIVKKDSIITKTENSILNEDSLKLLTVIFFKLRQDHNADSIEYYYSDTVVNYFKNLKNVPKSEITKSDKLYWKHFPDDKFIIKEPIKIISDSTGSKSFIKGKQCPNKQKCIEEIVELHFLPNKKINYVRAYYAN